MGREIVRVGWGRGVVVRKITGFFWYWVKSVRGGGG